MRTLELKLIKNSDAFIQDIIKNSNGSIVEYTKKSMYKHSSVLKTVILKDGVNNTYSTIVITNSEKVSRSLSLATFRYVPIDNKDGFVGVMVELKDSASYLYNKSYTLMFLFILDAIALFYLFYIIRADKLTYEKVDEIISKMNLGDFSTVYNESSDS